MKTLTFDTAEETQAEINRQFETYVCRHGENGFDTISRFQSGMQSIAFIAHDCSEAIRVSGPWLLQWDRLLEVCRDERP